MLKAELFLRWSKDELAIELDKMTEELRRQGLITVVNDELHINPSRSRTLQLLAAGARETLQRYAITFWLLSANPSINRGTLEKEPDAGTASFRSARHQRPGILRQSGLQFTGTDVA